MFNIVASTEDAFNQKHHFDGVLVEPSAYINNFITRSLNKFGVIKAPNEVLEMIQDNPERNIPSKYLDGIKSPMKKIFLRPNYDNTDGIMLSVSNKLREKDVYATPKGAALFFEWIINKKVDLNFNINLEVDMDIVAESYAEEKNRVFIPVVLERLLKLFAIFYGKEFKKGNKFLSAIQLNLLDAEKENDVSFIETSNFEDVMKIIKKVRKNHAHEFSSNNIFNKVLEELNAIIILKEKGFEVEYIGETMILKPTEETLTDSKEVFLKMLEG